MIKLQKHIKYCTIPIHFLEDESLSLEAKGLLSLLYAKDYSEFDDILTDEFTKDKLLVILNELSSKGYLEMSGDNYNISYKSSKSKQNNDTSIEEVKTKEDINTEVETTKKLNLYEKCMNAIDEFTEDVELKSALKEYLEIRLNPSKDSRLYDRKIAHLNVWKAQLNSLNTLTGNKLDIVNQSIRNAWAKFVDIDPNKVEGTPVYSNRYTKEEIEQIRERAKSLEKGKF